MKEILLICCCTFLTGCSCSYKSILLTDTDTHLVDIEPDSIPATPPDSEEPTEQATDATPDSDPHDSASGSDPTLETDSAPDPEDSFGPTATDTDSRTEETDTPPIPETDTPTMDSETTTVPHDTEPADAGTEPEETDTPVPLIDAGDTETLPTETDTMDSETPTIVDIDCDDLQISPDDDTALDVGQTHTYQAFCTTSSGEVVDVTDLVHWRSSNRESVDIVTVDAECVVEALAFDTRIVTLSAELRMTASSLIDTVNLLTYVKPQRDIELECVAACDNYGNGFMAPGTAAALRAVGYETDGTARYPKRCRWHSFDRTVVKAVDGVLFPLEAGDTPLEVACDDGSIVVEDLFSLSFDYFVVSVWPAAVTLPVGLPFQFEAAMYINYYSALGNPQWKSSDKDIVSFGGAQGVAVGNAVGGPVTVTASSLFYTNATAEVIVEDLAMEGLVIEPIDPRRAFFMSPGSKQILVAWAHYEGGRVYDVTPFVDWQVTDSEVADFEDISSRRAELAAKRIGTTTVFATFEDRTSNDVMITVGEKTVSAIDIATADGEKDISLPYKAGVTFLATATYSDGTRGDITHEVGWQLADPSLVRYHPPSTVTNDLANIGVTTLTATHEPSGETDSVTVETTLEIVESIEVYPAEATLPKGASASFEIMADHYPSGRRLPRTDDGFFFVSGDGAVYNGHQKGRFQTLEDDPTRDRTCDSEIDAEMWGLSSREACIVIDDVVAEQLELRAEADTLSSRAAEQLRCIAHFDDGREIDVSEDAVWTVDAPNVAWVSNVYGRRGRITAALVDAPVDTIATCLFGGLKASVDLTITP